MNRYVSLPLTNRKSSVHLHAMYSPRTALRTFTPRRDQLVICGQYSDCHQSTVVRRKCRHHHISANFLTVHGTDRRCATYSRLLPARWCNIWKYIGFVLYESPCILPTRRSPKRSLIFKMFQQKLHTHFSTPPYVFRPSHLH
jgi:hypothetical protein